MPLEELRLRSQVDAPSVDVNPLDDLQAGRFVALRGYRRSDGAVRHYLINGAPSYRNYNERKLAWAVAARTQLEALTLADVLPFAEAAHPLLSKALAKRHATPEDLAISLLADVAAGYDKVIGHADGSTPIPERADPFAFVARGVKHHVETNELHVMGLLVSSERVSDPTKVAPVPRATTVAKDAIRAMAEAGLDLPVWVQFRLGDNFESVSFEGRTIRPQEAAMSATR